MAADKETPQSVAGQMENTENRAMRESDSDYPRPHELAAEQAELSHDPELGTENPLIYEQMLDSGGETRTGQQIPESEAEGAPRARPGAH